MQECKVPAAEISEIATQLYPPAAAPVPSTARTDAWLPIGSLVHLNPAGLMTEPGYDWSADSLTPDLNGTIVAYCVITGYTHIKSCDSSQGEANCDLSHLKLSDKQQQEDVVS